MRCCVPFCQNTSDNVSEGAGKGTSFHGFPSEVHLRAAWLRALGKQDGHLPDSAVVCSLHFLNDDIYETKSGFRQIVTGAIPSTVQVCMICLDTDSKLILMSKHKLVEAYEQLTGHPLYDPGNLKQTLCVQCAQRLINFSRFRDKSLRARALMMDLVEKHELITRQHIQMINRTKHRLTSNMVLTTLGPDHCDLHILEHPSEDKQTELEESGLRDIVKTEESDDSMSVDGDMEVLHEVDNNVNDVVQDPLKYESASLQCTLCLEEFVHEHDYKGHIKSMHLQNGAGDGECATSQVCEPHTAVSSSSSHSSLITENKKIMNRGRFLVNMVEERDNENIRSSFPTQYENIPLEQEFEQITQKEAVLVDRPQLEVDLRMSLSDKYSSKETHVVDNHFPSTSKQSFTPNYCISLIRSDESLSSDSSSSDIEDESAHVQLDSQNAMVAEINAQEPVIGEKKGKKRVRKPTMWKSEVAKALRNSGKAYQSLSKSKKQVKDRKVGPPCDEKCRIKCRDKIDETSRQQLFDAFWGLGNLDRQREFIVRHSQKIKPKYRYSSTQRALNTAFYFEVDESKIRVCKPFFKSTLDLSYKTIQTALSKKSESGVIEADLRGKHGHQPTIDPQIKRSVIDFINSIPRIESHYLRAQTTRQFISSDKSLAGIYRDYKQQLERDGLAVATPSTFKRIFHTELNLLSSYRKKINVICAKGTRTQTNER